MLNGRKITSLKFQMIYSPDSDSSILEASDQNDMDFLHVEMNEDKQYEFKFFLKDEYVTLTLPQIQEIMDFALKNVKYVGG